MRWAVWMVVLWAASADAAGRAPADEAMTKTATFGAGCFWGVEKRFAQVPGVVSTEVGYMGGSTDRPTYEEVCTGRTGHAEVVRVVYDPARVHYDALLAIFWEWHDPTTLNRQGPDVGTQYRSVIFTEDEMQATAARRSKQVLEEAHVYPRPLVTEIVPAGSFWQAEEYHQQYLAKTPGGYCSHHLQPQSSKIRQVLEGRSP